MRSTFSKILNSGSSNNAQLTGAAKGITSDKSPTQQKNVGKFSKTDPYIGSPSNPDEEESKGIPSRKVIT